jgi:LacI family transcriptional regulator
LVTRDDVARQAGTSTAVVSYVINNGPRPVAADTRARVLRAIADLGYQPNAAARALSRRRDDLIGLLVPNVDNPFFAMVATAVESASVDKGFTVVLGNTRNVDARRAEYVTTLLGRQASGLILVGAAHEADGSHGPRTSEMLADNAGVPLVSFDPLPDGAVGTTLMPQNVKGAALAVGHLVEHGHRRIGMLGGPPRFTAVRERDRGWREALTAADIAPGDLPVYRSRFDRYEAFDVMAQLLTTPLPFTALFVHTDEQAIGVIHACHAAGLSLPDDLAIVSFDGIREAALVTPRLTSVHQPIVEMARRAVDLIEQQVAHPPTSRTTERTPCTLVVRESCGCS